LSAGVHACDLLIDCLVVVAGRTIYDMCTQKAPHDYSQELYERYKITGGASQGPKGLWPS